MSIIRWSPWDALSEMEDVFNSQKSFMPALDMYETKDAVVVESPLAGVDPKDVEITVENGVLTVKGETSKEHEMDEKNYYRHETRSGSFYRQVVLPVAVKESEVSAQFEEGILKITCPKSGEEKTKKIEVKVVKK